MSSLANGLAGEPSEPIQFRRLTFQRGRIPSARFAPDGKTIVFSAAWEGRPVDIFTTRTDSAESRSLGLPGVGPLRRLLPG